MIQVKIFEDSDIQDLEDDINVWLGENPGIEVFNVTQSEAGFMDTKDEEPIGNTTISIFYKKDTAS